MSHSDIAPTETAFSTKKEKIGGVNLKNAKGFSGGALAGQACPLGGEAELRLFAGNRFELRCKIEPN